VGIKRKIKEKIIQVNLISAIEKRKTAKDNPKYIGTIRLGSSLSKRPWLFIP